MPWNLYATAYDRVLCRLPAYWDLLREVTDIVKPPPQNVIDIGAGTGNACQLLLDKGHIVLAVDNNSSMLDCISQKLGARQSLTLMNCSAERI